jgi:hypothetical protein
MYHRKQVLAIVKTSGVEFRLHDLHRTFATIVNHYLERCLSAYTIKRLLELLRPPMELVESFVLRSAGLADPLDVVALQRAA